MSDIPHDSTATAGGDDTLHHGDTTTAGGDPSVVAPSHDQTHAGAEDQYNGADGEDYYDDGADGADSEMSDLDPEARVLEPVQRRIEGQLRKNLEELTLNVHETKNEARMIKQRREDCGVELYNAQQHLAKLQEGLERGHDNFHAIQRLRQEKEEERSALNGECDGVQSQMDELQKKYNKYQVELDKLSVTVLQVEKYNEQMQREIAIERRVAYKAEDDIVQLEKKKTQQDGLIDHLNERLRTLSEQHAACCAQLASQKNETKVARDTLAEALGEMESINFEKKQLVQQWRTSIIGMQRRDEALRATEDALNEQKEQLMSLDNEIVGYRQSIKKAQAQNAKLSEILSKAENEVSILEKQCETMSEKRSKATEKFDIQKKALEATDADNKVIEQENKAINSEISAMVKRAQKAARDVVDMENKVIETLNKQTTLKKGSQSALSDIEKMKAVIRDKELHVTQMENELARIRVDTLQTQSHNEVLKQTVGELERELKSRDTLIEKMQVDIRRKHDEIERKQKTLDSLNRQFEGIIAAHGAEEGEHVGPLEATINNLSKSITQRQNENNALQRDWIKLQTELVNSRTNNQQLTESIRELKAQCTILTQKRNRLLTSTKQQHEEINQLERQTQHLHLEMKKLNTLVCGNAKAQEEAANANYNLETDLVKRLQERKTEAIQLETKIDGVRENKAELLAKILDAERQVMFWEKKIKIAKETEEALDPTMGKEEIHRMKKEIYVMEQRLANLEREQRRKVEEMQKLIEHRDVLRTKGQAIQAATKAGQKGVTKATVNKDNARMSTDLNKKKTDAQQKETQIKECLSNTERTAVEVEKVMQETSDIRQEIGQLQQDMAIQQQVFNRTMEEKQRKTSTIQRYRDAEKGMYNLMYQPEQVQEKQKEIDDKKRALMDIMYQLKDQFPEVNRELTDLTNAL